MAEAVELIEKGGKACDLVKDGIIVATEDGSGIKPLLRLLDEKSALLKDAWVVAKVIGRAAAAICIMGGAKRVDALIMADDAAALLASHGIIAGARKRVERIRNRENTDFCPMELASEGLLEPADIVEAVRKRAAELAIK